MTKKEAFKAAIQNAVTAFNNSVDPALQERIEKANKLRSFLNNLEYSSTDENILAFARELDSSGINGGYRDAYVGEVPRNISAFLIFRATNTSNGHKYGSHWCFCRGPESRAPFIVSPNSDYAGASRNNICEPAYWETPAADELDAVIEDAWNIIKCDSTLPLARYIDLYFSPLPFLFDPDEDDDVTPAAPEQETPEQETTEEELEE
jgi:hypothetical protein